MRTYAPLAFNTTPEENQEFHNEAKRLGGIDLIDLFRRMMKTWKTANKNLITITAEEEKRKKQALVIPGDPKYGT